MRLRAQDRFMQAHFIEIRQIFAKNKVVYFSNRVDREPLDLSSDRKTQKSVAPLGAVSQRFNFNSSNMCTKFVWNFSRPSRVYGDIYNYIRDQSRQLHILKPHIYARPNGTRCFTILACIFITPSTAGASRQSVRKDLPDDQTRYPHPRKVWL